MKDRDVAFIDDIVEIAKYLNWHSEIGDKKAQEIINEIHEKKYGSTAGVWPQWDRIRKSLVHRLCETQPLSEEDLV